MYRVTFDYKDKNGFLKTETEKFTEFKAACSWIRGLTNRYLLVGKPVLERI
jgi:hypothetical protein